MGFVFCAGTPLNLVVLLAVAKYKKLRVPLNYILVNISFAGFIFVTFSVSQVFFASLKGYYFFGHTLCALESAVGSIAGLVTAWSLAVLSFARYLVICKPFGAFKFDTNHAMGAVLFTWVIGVFCATPPFWGWSRFQTPCTRCSKAAPEHNRTSSMFHSRDSVLFFICFISASVNIELMCQKVPVLSRLTIGHSPRSFVACQHAVW
uniref:G-protein coupled receptors family 1 profile domain-containing protein n=1 Tax=Amphiprion ocellaris TaxID=80972 RepID=A0AAQ5YUB4_AMPOC